MAALNEMDVINIDKMKSKKEKKYTPFILLNVCLDAFMEFVDLSSEDYYSITQH